MPKNTFHNLPEEKRHVILDVAIDEFSQKDFSAVSITHIVSRAGIAKGSFYQYFEDKRDLYLYLMEIAGTEKQTFLRMNPPPDPGMGLFPYLRWLFNTGFQFQLSNPRLAMVAYRALYTDMPFRDEVLMRFKMQVNDFYRHLLQMGIAQGDIDPDIDLEVAVFYLDTLFGELGNYMVRRLGIGEEQFSTMHFADAYREKMDEIYNHVINLLEHGLGSKEKH